MDNQNRYVLAHIDLVAPLARRLKRRLPDSFELEDLIQAGYLGLLRAARQQDGRAPSNFYARFRIWAAMLDSVQGEAWWWATARVDGDPATCEELTPRDIPGNDSEETGHENLGAALAALPPLQRELLHLVYEHGESLRRIGHERVLEIGWRRVQHEHAEALAALRGILEGDVDLPRAA